MTSGTTEETGPPSYSMKFALGLRKGCSDGGGRAAAGNAPWSNDLHERNAVGHGRRRLRCWGVGVAQHGIADDGRETHARGGTEHRQ